MKPEVGVITILRQGELVLLGLRKSKHAHGFWGLPGGHLEGGESFEQCAIREMEEETGVILPSVQVLGVENTVYHAEQKHYVVVVTTALVPAGQEPKVMEPAKCAQWTWFLWDDLPTPLMLIAHKVRAKYARRWRNP